MFIVRADFKDKIEVKTSAENIRRFYSDTQNFVGLMPNVESIYTDGHGITHWKILAEIPFVGTMRQTFAVSLIEDTEERVEWSPANFETRNLLRYSADLFEISPALTIVQISQIMELRRAKAMDLHPLAMMASPSAISQGMQTEISRMMKNFLLKSKEKLER